MQPRATAAIGNLLKGPRLTTSLTSEEQVVRWGDSGNRNSAGWPTTLAMEKACKWRREIGRHCVVRLQPPIIASAPAKTLALLLTFVVMTSVLGINLKVEKRKLRFESFTSQMQNAEGAQRSVRL